jgi:hypothetical protein
MELGGSCVRLAKHSKEYNPSRQADNTDVIYCEPHAMVLVNKKQ